MLKNEKIKENPLKKTEKSNTIKFCKKKITVFQQMITKTILAVQKYKVMDIVGASDMNTCIQNLEILYKELDNLNIRISQPSKTEFDDVITNLQKINNELSALFRSTGTNSIEDLITVAMGNEFLKNLKGDKPHNVSAVTRPYSWIEMRADIGTIDIKWSETRYCGTPANHFPICWKWVNMTSYCILNIPWTETYANALNMHWANYENVCCGEPAEYFDKCVSIC